MCSIQKSTQYKQLDKKPEPDKQSIFRNKYALMACIIYAVLGSAFTMYDETFPLWAMASVDKGGLAAETNTIGIIGTINGISAVVIQLTFFGFIANRLGFIRLFRMGAVIGTLLFVNFPVMNNFHDRPVPLWILMSILIFFKVCVGQFCFASISAVISNSTPLRNVGAVNGLGQSLVALARTFSPAIAGTLLSWGFSNGRGFPFNQYAVFILTSLLMGCITVASFLLPDSLRHPYVDPNTPHKEGKEEEPREMEVMIEAF